MRQIVSGAAVIVVCVWLQGCDADPPTRPIRVTPPPVLPLPAGSAPKLEISAFSVLEGGNITLRVTETGSEGGADIGWVMTRDERGNTDGGVASGCGAGRMHVAPGATWDILSMGYCAPTAPSSDSKTVTVVVGFTGDDRVQGELTRTVSR